MDCIFCKIADKKIKADIVFESNEVLAFRDINPQAPVHILIIPKKHLSSVMDLTSADDKLLASIFQAARDIAKKEGAAESGFRLVINNGQNAGQAVDHLHVHLLGKRKLSWPPG